jgi:hypothetical protein
MKVIRKEDGKHKVICEGKDDVEDAVSLLMEMALDLQLIQNPAGVLPFRTTFQHRTSDGRLLPGL